MGNTRSHRAISLFVGVLSIGAVGWVGYASVPWNTSQQPAAATPRPSARDWLGVLGLDAESLAAAGVSQSQAQHMVADLDVYFESSGVQFLHAVDRYNAAKREWVNANRSLQAGADPQSVNIAGRQTELAAAESERTTLINGAFAAAVSRLPSEIGERLATIKSAAEREVPAAYRLTARSDSEWIALRDALAAEKQATTRGGQVPTPVTRLLADVRAEPKTAAALQRGTGAAAIRATLAR